MKQFIIGVFLLLFVGSYSTLTASHPIYKRQLSTVAIGGYDSVAYFKVGAPVIGKKEFSTKWHGADWYFSSKENLDIFLSNPEKFSPQYGGYCAYAIAIGKRLVASNPEVWHIHKGKLYLNYNKSVQDNWLIDKEIYIQEGDIVWGGYIK